MKIQWPKRKDKTSFTRDFLAKKIAYSILRVQRQWAVWMGRQARKASIKTQWIVLIIFIIAALCNCTWLLYRAFNKPASSIKGPPDQLIRVQPPYNKDKANINPPTTVSDSLTNDTSATRN